MNRTRKALAGLVATATVVAPLATVASVATAPAAHADGWRPIITSEYGVSWFSPNKDRSQDKLKKSVTVREASAVTVKVRRTKTEKLVYKEHLGQVGGPQGWGSETWVWNGKDRDGNVVRDGQYTVTFVAHANVDGKRQARSATVYVDTQYDVPKKPTTSLDLLYPRTTALHDAMGVILRGKGRMATVGSAVLRVIDKHGRVVHRVSGSSGWYAYTEVVFDGRDKAGQPLPAGTYTLTFKVTDKAGNTGKSKSSTVRISDKALVEKTATLTLPPTGSWTSSSVLDGTAPAPTVTVTPPNSVNPYPCGQVVPSDVYSNPGAASYRSAENCSGSFAAKGAFASGSVALDHLTFEEAPRGGVSSYRVAMRGRPTVPGETDTATLGGLTFGFHGVIETPNGVTSPVVTQETVTTSAKITVPQPAVRYYTRPQGSLTRTVGWTVVTRGTDSFDVADVTVTYTYLTPQ